MKIESLQQSWRPIGCYVTSGAGEDDKPDCELVMYLRRWSVRIGLPQIIKPDEKKVIPKSWDAATIARLGRDYYIDYTRRDYGFLAAEGHLSVYLGRQTDDSYTEQRWSCFLPWTQWRFVRYSLYGLDGELLWTELEKDRKPYSEASEQSWNVRARRPHRSFLFSDFDGEEITAVTTIEEREWHFGEGWFRWLSWFRKPKIHRDIDIQFSKETGRRKGSWKGGTTGHSIELLSGELHESAFRRYCAEHDMKFIGPSRIPP